MKPYIDIFDAVTEEGKPFQYEKHSHDFFEIYCFLEGDAEYTVEGRRYPLNPGDLVLLRRGEVHKLERLSLQRYRRIGVHFDPTNTPDFFPVSHLLSPFLQRPSGKFNHYPANLFPGNHWLHYLKQIAKNEYNTKIQLCYLLSLLCELTDAFPVLQQSKQSTEKDPATPIMKYINNHLSEELSLSSLAEKFYMSQTHLNRLFRQSANITVWEYITIKRLFLAKELIAEGNAPTKIYTNCGFREYSTFFRAYKRQFGVSPSFHTNI